MASLKGNPEGALVIYESYLDDLTPSSNLWVQFQYSIGQAKISMGDLAGAREALELIENHPTVGRDVQRLFSEMTRHLREQTLNISSNRGVVFNQF